MVLFFRGFPGMEKLRLFCRTLIKVCVEILNILHTKLLSALFLIKPNIIEGNIRYRLNILQVMFKYFFYIVPEMTDHFPHLFAKIFKFKKFLDKFLVFSVYFILDCKLNGRDTILVNVFFFYIYRIHIGIFLVLNKC